MELSQRLNKVAAEYRLNGGNDALLAIAACVLLDVNNEVAFDGRDMPGTLGRITAALSAAQKKAALDALAGGTATAVPVCRKYTVTLAQIKALGAVTTGSIQILGLTDAVIFDFAVEALGFTGPSLTAALIQLVGGAGGFGGPVDGDAGQRLDNDFGSDIVGLPVSVQGENLAVQIVLSGCNASALTGGTIHVWVTYLERP